jgi:hypothetical protein
MEGCLSFQGKSNVSHTLLQFVFWGVAGLQLRKAEPQNLDVGTARPETEDWTDCSKSNVRVIEAWKPFFQ